MKNKPPRRVLRFLSSLLAIWLLAAPISAQQPARPAARPPQTPIVEHTLESLLAADTYKLYGEVRNVGQLLSTGGAGEIVEPIIKLADPGKEFKSIINFLKKNSEALFSCRLQFGTWPARTDLPMVFVAIEFPTSEDATKFAPKLENFLPTVLPPLASPDPMPTTSPNRTEPPPPVTKSTQPQALPNSPSPQNVEHLPFVIKHSGNFVFFSEKPFKFEKLHPASSKPLFQDQNFRAVRDKFSTEPIFLFFDVALEDKTKPQPSPKQIAAEQEAERIRAEGGAKLSGEPAVKPGEPQPTPEKTEEETAVELSIAAAPQVSPTPLTKEQAAQITASSQIGRMLDSLGFGEPQWPEALGVALVLDGNEYVLRAMLIDKPNAKTVPIPFVPQLISGPAYNAEASSVLPDDTEAFVSASIDFAQSYEGMRRQAEIKAKSDTVSNRTVYRNGVLIESSNRLREPPPDPFTEFEKNAGFKIKDDLVPALGNEIAVAGSLSTLQQAGGFRMGGIEPLAAPSADKNDPKQKPKDEFPVFLIGVKDRDAMRRLMPKVLDGFGIGAANLLAQTERLGDAEIVNYAGLLAYGFVGDFLVISEAPVVRRVAQAYADQATLSSNSVYRNARRWQPGRTLGQVYVSPVLMEAYHEQVRKEAGTLEPAMRDFLLSLNPKSEAITYALSNDGLGTQHELHLPKNLILTMVAGISAASKNIPPEANEMVAISGLQMIANAEAQYKAGSKNGPYGTLKDLVDAKLFPLEELEKYGYKFEVTVMGDQFEAVATPKEYGKNGKRSFFVDKSGVVRGDDHGGGPATIADKPVRQ